MFGKGDRAAARSGDLSFIGTGVTVTGNIGGDGNLHVDGRIDGDVTCATLIVGERGEINGNVRAGDARIAGTVNGAVAAEVLTVTDTARIVGDMSYDAVSIETGAQVEGRVKRLTREDAGGGLKLIAGDHTS